MKQKQGVPFANVGAGTMMIMFTILALSIIWLNKVTATA